MAYLIGPSSVVSSVDRVVVYRSGKAILPRRGLVSVTAIARVSPAATLDVSQVTIVDKMGAVIRVPFGRGDYDVTSTAGNATVTANMKLATVIIGQHQWRLMNGGGGAPYPGQDDQTVDIGAGYAVPYRALELLAGLPLPSRVGGFA